MKNKANITAFDELMIINTEKKVSLRVSNGNKNSKLFDSECYWSKPDWFRKAR